jgi:hypothetical protein
MKRKPTANETMPEPAPAVQVGPMEEPPDFLVAVKVGRTLLEWLDAESRRQFGRANRSGLLRILIHDRFKQGTSPVGS